MGGRPVRRAVPPRTALSGVTALLLVCLSIDFANPLLPGSQRFDASQSVDAVRADRAWTSPPASGPAAPAPLVAARPPEAPARREAGPRVHPAPGRRARSLAPEPAAARPPADDH